MRICLYTLCDFKPMAIECIELLLKSITFDIPVDFFILTNVSSNKYVDYKNFTIISDHSSNNNYIGYMKYSPAIPDGYDYYIYLDADILYFDNISKLIDKSKSFTVVTEDCLINNNQWFYFPYLSDQQEISKLKSSIALNAGSFCFRHDYRYVIEMIYETYNKYKQNKTEHDVKLEQAAFNLLIHKELNYSLENCHDITSIVQLFAAKKGALPSKTLYHFCWFTNEMSSKFNSMKVFYDKYKK